jgi:hypothetical protein
MRLALVDKILEIAVQSLKHIQVEFCQGDRFANRNKFIKQSLYLLQVDADKIIILS